MFFVQFVHAKIRREFLTFTSLALALVLGSCGKVAEVANQGISAGAQGPLSLPPIELLPISLEVPYKETIVAKGGIQPYTFKIISGELIEGLTFDATTGIIAGTVAKAQIAKTEVITVEVTDSASLTAQQSFTLSTASYTTTIAPTEIPTITPGISYALQFNAIGAVPPVKYSLSGSLPQKLTMDATGALLTDDGGVSISDENTTWAVEVSATDANGVVASEKFTIVIGEAPEIAQLTIQTTALLSMQVGSYSGGISTTGGVAPLTYSIESGSLPTGLTLDTETGVISGTIPIDASGDSYAIVMKVVDANGATDSKTFSGTVTAGSSTLIMHTSTLSAITAGVAFSYTLAVTGGSTPYTFGISGGSLPSGMNLNSASGLISGTPAPGTANQAYAFTITCTDAAAQTASKTFVGTVGASSNSAVAIVTTTIPTPTAGSSYLAAIGVTGGASPYTYTISSGALPDGLTINANSGLISGTVDYAAKGSAYLFTVTVADSGALTASQIYSGFVGTYSTSIVPAALSDATPGAEYTVALSSIGGEAPYTYTQTTGTLPSGLSLNGSTGVITGTVSEAEAGLTKNFTIRSTDANGVQATVALSLSTSAFVVTLTTASLTNAIENSAYTNSATSLAATGGTTPYSFEYTGTLPNGVGLTSAGVFFGTPTTGSGALAGGTVYTIYVRARDAANRRSAQVALTLTVTISEPTIAAGSPSSAVLGSSYSYTLSSTGGRSPYTYSLTGGSLPTGLSLSSAGVITGTATEAATCPANNFDIEIVDILGQTSATSTKCIATASGVSISNTSFPTVVVGVNYNSSVTVSGGTAPYAYSASGLPSGVSLHPTTGALSGFVNDPVDDYQVYITVTDSSSPALSTTRSFIFEVTDPLVVISASLPLAGTEAAYDPVSIAASGGLAPYTFAISAGSLPDGLNMDSSGEISGTPTFDSAAVNGGTYNFSVVASDNSGLSSAAQSFTMYVSVAPKITSTTLPPGVVGRPYAYDLERIGGVNTFNGTSVATRLVWSAADLPAGLTLNTATGRISGTPSSAVGSPFSITVGLTDANSISTSKVVTMEVNVAGKTLDLEAARAQEICPVDVITYNCNPRGFKLANLVAAAPNDKYIVYSANISPGTLAAPAGRIYIVKLDSKGRFTQPLTATNGTTSIVYNPTSTAFITSLDVGDIDNDGHEDIVFADHANNRITVVWNDGTVDINGMPNFTTQHNFSMPGGGTTSNRPYKVKIASIRPFGVDAAKKDLIVSDWSFGAGVGGSILGTAAGRMVVYLAQSACSGDCSGTRAAAYSGAGASITAYNTTLGAGPAGLLYFHDINIGYFDDPPGPGVCPSLVIAGKSSAANTDHLYLRHQTFDGSLCDGNFSTHGATDEKTVTAAATYYPGLVSTADLNNDGISDIAVPLQNVSPNSANVKIYIMPGSNLFPANPVQPYLPNTTGVTYGAASVSAYCIDGSTSCNYPALLVVGNRDLALAATGGNGFISILPNTGSAPYFDDNSQTTRIDYVAPNGVSDIPILAPVVTAGKNDVALIGSDQNGLPYYFLLTRNGNSSTNPFRQAPMLRNYPDVYSAFAEAGAIRLADINEDGELDVFTHLVNQSAVSLHIGDVNSKDPSLLATATYNGMGVSHGYPNTWHMPKTIDVRDFNNDGIPDVAVTGYTSRAISVALGNGSNDLESASMYDVGSAGDVRPYGIIAEDFDQDGFQDIITMNYTSTTATSSFSFFRGKGDGNFHDAVEFFTNSAIGCPDVRTAVAKDLNGDGRPELVVLCYASQALWIARRHVDGNWIKQSGTTLNAGGGANGTALAVGRLNSIVGSDIVLGGLDVNNTQRIISGVTLGTPDASGNFTVSGTASSYYRLMGYLSEIEISDLNADGYGDIVTTMQSGNLSGIQAGQILYTCTISATNTCALEGWGLEQPNSTGLAVGDLDGDGLPDIVQGGKVGQRLYYRTLSRYFNASY